MRLGILGGTFNPIHTGHLLLAECAREQCALDRVLFVPAATPPHKAAPDLLDGRQRLALIRLAIRGHAAFQASDVELKLGGVSYTVRTLQALHARHPAAKLFFLVGSDMLRVPWHRWDDVKRLCTFIVADRRSHPSRALKSGQFGKVQWLTMPQIEIASSTIRARIRQRRSIRYLVPDAVARYIATHRLFQRGRA